MLKHREVDFIDFKWFHFDLKSMKSLGLKPSVLFETTSPCRFHWFHFNLKRFHWFQIISNDFNSIWNQWNQPREVVSNRTDGFNPRDFIDFKWFQMISIQFEMKWNHPISNRTDGFNPRDFIDFKWFQIEMKSFEINEIRTSTSCDGLETAFHWFRIEMKSFEINMGKWFQTELMALTLEISLISNRNEIIWNQWNRQGRNPSRSW